MKPLWFDRNGIERAFLSQKEEDVRGTQINPPDSMPSHALQDDAVEEPGWMSSALDEWYPPLKLAISQRDGPEPPQSSTSYRRRNGADSVDWTCIGDVTRQEQRLDELHTSACDPEVLELNKVILAEKISYALAFLTTNLRHNADDQQMVTFSRMRLEEAMQKWFPPSYDWNYVRLSMGHSSPEQHRRCSSP